MSSSKARILADYRPSSFNINNTNLVFDLSDHKTIVTNTMDIVKADINAGVLTLDGEHIQLLSISIDDSEIPADQYTLSDNQLSLSISINLTEFSLVIVTEIDPANNSALEGLYKSGGAYCTQCEAEGFRRITYYLDRPDVMSTFTTKVIAEQDNYPFLLSNGNKIEQGELAEGKHYVVWHDPFPKPCYLFALVAGDFDLLTDSYKTKSGKDVALEIFVDKGNKDKAIHAMSSLKHSMKWDEDTFGLEYDLDIYMIVAVDFFNMGAMENKGLNVFNSKYVLADQQSATDVDYFNIEAVIGHEYFHNWTGNRVTCRDWFQLSLKEGLTVFRDQEFSADMNSAAVSRIRNVSHLRAAQFPEDEGPMAHPIRPEKVVEMNNFYTMTVYEKGAEVIRMIHTLLGKENFRKGMDLYFKRFDGMAVTCDDFVNAMSDASNIDLTQFKHWYSQSGTPTLEVHEHYDAANQSFNLTVKQLNTPTKVQPEKELLLIPIRIELLGDNVKESHLLTLSQKTQTWTFDNMAIKPVVAFLSDFSAPVKVRFSQSDSDLTQIMIDATDSFNRWDAGQTLVTRHINRLLTDSNYQLPSSLLMAYKSILNADVDPALKAESLQLPSFEELVVSFDDVDPQKLINAIEVVEKFLAGGLSNEFTATYKQYCELPYANDGDSVGERALKNVCLSYLALLPKNADLIELQFNHSDNMTDTLAALKFAGKTQVAQFEQLMQVFEQNWATNTLVMDKWFSLQATANRNDMFEKLAQLENHSSFTLDNPNRARSLIGVFSHSNPKYFHQEDGKGYEFLTKHIKALDTINPQVASRLITPLIQYKRFNHHHSELMKAQLVSISTIKDLSKDLQEKLDAALT